MRLAAAHHADVGGLGGEGALDRGHVELGVVGEDAHRIARPEQVPRALEQRARPGHDDLVGHGEAALGRENLARVAHGDPVPEHLGDAGEGRGEVHGTEDPHPRRRREGLHEHPHGLCVLEVLGGGLTLRPVVAHDGARGLELAECVTQHHPVEPGIAERAGQVTLWRDRHGGAGAGTLDHRAQRDRQGLAHTGREEVPCRRAHRLLTIPAAG